MKGLVNTLEYMDDFADCIFILIYWNGNACPIAEIWLDQESKVNNNVDNNKSYHMESLGINDAKIKYKDNRTL